jgi:hypothetical protein
MKNDSIQVNVEKRIVNVGLRLFLPRTCHVNSHRKVYVLVSNRETLKELGTECIFLRACSIRGYFLWIELL